MPVWLHWRSLDAGEIAVLLAAPLFTRIFFTPLIGFAADLAGSRRNIVVALAWGSLLSFLLLWAADGFWQMLLASIVLAVNWTTITPLIETVATSGIRNGTLDYGRVRLWGPSLHRGKSRSVSSSALSTQGRAAGRRRHGASF
jgi:PPP family 3-phenylpropionic acid transporter